MQPEQMVGQVLGHYRILRPLGYGGTAIVFLAEDIHLQREVAIKVFLPGEGDTKDFLRRFAREARVLAQLDHPNILPVYDYGEQDSIAYLVMPRMAGGSLKDRLSGRGPLPAQEVVRLIGQILNALQYAHDRGLIHRDIKPGNMLFKGDGTLLLSDFGLVKILTSEEQPLFQQDLTATGTGHTIAGTPNYIAPEQIIGHTLPASDIYSVGITLYEMLTGSRPFDTNNYMGILIKHMYEQPRPPRTLNPQISPALEAVVMRSLEKDPAKRYQRPADFLEELTQAIQAIPTADTFLSTRSNSESGIIPPRSGQLTPPSPTLFQQNIPDGTLLQEDEASSGIPLHPTLFDAMQTSRTPYPPPNIQHTLSVSNPITTPPVQQSFPLSSSIAPVQKRSTVILIAVLMSIILLLIGSLGTVLLLRPGSAGPALSTTGQPSTTLESTSTIRRQTPTVAGPTPKPSADGTNFGVNTTPIPSSPPSPIATTQPVTQPTTACPSAGTGRAAIMPPTALGNDQNIIYIVNESPPNPKQGTVKRYDVTADTRTEINKTAGSSISEGQVSHDGQWVLFTINVSGQVELRLVRVDGQVLQTLYCAASNAIISGTQWTLDQKLVIFDQQIGLNKPVTYLLDLTTGRIQTELVPQSNLAFIPRLWLDNTHVYMVGFIPNSEASPQNIYLLDTAKGASQHERDLQTIASASSSCTAFDSSVDSTQLFVSTCANGASPGFGIPTGPSTITGQSATGGPTQVIYTNSIQGVVTVRAISKTTLLLLVENQTGNVSQNGLWKVQTNGTGLTRLTIDSNNSQSLCSYTQYTWSNISRDGTMYALQAYDPNTNKYSTAFGSLSGGSPTWFTGISDGTQLYLLGWTHM